MRKPLPKPSHSNPNVIVLDRDALRRVAGGRMPELEIPPPAAANAGGQL